MGHSQAMIRTIISLDKDTKAWLDEEAAREKLPMTAIIRRAVALLRGQGGGSPLSTDDLLAKTRGTWKQGDGLAWQRRLRDAW